MPLYLEHRWIASLVRMWKIAHVLFSIQFKLILVSWMWPSYEIFSETNSHETIWCAIWPQLCHMFWLSSNTSLYVIGQPGLFVTMWRIHYIDVIMTTMASHITSLTVVYSTVYSDADQRKHQSSASLAFVWGIHRERWIPRTKGQLRRKCLNSMTSSWNTYHSALLIILASIYNANGHANITLSPEWSPRLANPSSKILKVTKDGVIGIWPGRVFSHGFQHLEVGYD